MIEVMEDGEEWRAAYMLTANVKVCFDYGLFLNP